MTAAQDSRAQFEAGFPVPSGVSWNGVEYVVADDYLNSYRVNVFIGQWAAWQASRAALSAEPAGMVESHDVVYESGGIKITRLNLSAEGREALECRASEITPAPQPAAQERKPLSDERIFELNLEAWDKMRDHTVALLRFARFVEREHGIRGEKK